jgi:hypothetical protein
MGENGTIYWTIVAAVAGAAWTLVTAIRDRRSKALEQSRAIMDRLQESDKLLVEHPDIAQYLSATAANAEPWFREPARLVELQFFKAKSYLYSQLSLFDEVLSVASQTGGGFASLFKPPGILDIADWEEYMKHRLSHPLARSIMANEAPIFGRALQDFWSRHREAISRRTPDPHSW